MIKVPNFFIGNRDNFSFLTFFLPDDQPPRAPFAYDALSVHRSRTHRDHTQRIARSILQQDMGLPDHDQDLPRPQNAYSRTAWAPLEGVHARPTRIKKSQEQPQALGLCLTWYRATGVWPGGRRSTFRRRWATNILNQASIVDNQGKHWSPRGIYHIEHLRLVSTPRRTLHHRWRLERDQVRRHFLFDRLWYIESIGDGPWNHPRG